MNGSFLQFRRWSNQASTRRRSSAPRNFKRFAHVPKFAGLTGPRAWSILMGPLSREPNATLRQARGYRTIHNFSGNRAGAAHDIASAAGDGAVLGYHFPDYWVRLLFRRFQPWRKGGGFFGSLLFRRHVTRLSQSQPRSISSSARSASIAGSFHHVVPISLLIAAPDNTTTCASIRVAVGTCRRSTSRGNVMCSCDQRYATWHFLSNRQADLSRCAFAAARVARAKKGHR